MNMQFSYLAERCNCMQSSTIVMICSLSVCDASVLWQNGWSCLVYLFLLTYARKHTLSISFLKLCHSYILKKKLKKEPAYHHLTYCTFIPQWSDQYSNMPHRSGTLLWPSFKLSVWRLFNEGLLTLFLVTPPPPLIFLLSLASSLQARREDLAKRFSETFVDLTIVYTTLFHPLETWPWHPRLGSLLYIQGQASELKDIAQQCLTHSYIFSRN